MDVLILEDYPDTLALLRRLVVLRGHRAYPAGDVQAAWALVRERDAGANGAPGDPFDALLADVNLPDGDGIEFVQDLTDAARRPRLVVLISGDPKDWTRAHAAGVEGYLSKPFNLEDLFVLLESADPQGSKKGG